MPGARFLTLASVVVVAVLAACSRPADPTDGRANAQAVQVKARPASPIAEALCANPRIRVQVLEVARTGPEVVTVKFVLVNPDTATAVTVAADMMAAVSLLDEAQQKQYFVMRDDQDRVQCTTGLGTIPPAGHVAAWSRFPSPPEGVERITIQVPGVPALRNLPIAANGTGQPAPSY